MQWLDVRDGKRGRYVNWRGVNRYFADFRYYRGLNKVQYRNEVLLVSGWMEDGKHGTLALILNGSEYAKIIPLDKLILI